MHHPATRHDHDLLFVQVVFVCYPLPGPFFHLRSMMIQTTTRMTRRSYQCVLHCDYFPPLQHRNRNPNLISLFHKEQPSWPLASLPSWFFRSVSAAGQLFPRIIYKLKFFFFNYINFLHRPLIRNTPLLVAPYPFYSKNLNKMQIIVLQYVA